MCESKKAVLTLGLGQHAAILICRKTFTYRAHCLKTKATAARDSTVGTVQGRMQRALSPRYLLQLVLPLVLRDTGSSSSRLPSSTGGRSPLTSSHTHTSVTCGLVCPRTDTHAQHSRAASAATRDAAQPGEVIWTLRHSPARCWEDWGPKSRLEKEEVILCWARVVLCKFPHRFFREAVRREFHSLMRKPRLRKDL